MFSPWKGELVEELADVVLESVRDTSAVALALREAGRQIGGGGSRDRGWVARGDGVHGVGMRALGCACVSSGPFILSAGSCACVSSGPSILSAGSCAGVATLLLTAGRGSSVAALLLLSLSNGWTKELADVGAEGVVDAAGVAFALRETRIQGGDA